MRCTVRRSHPLQPGTLRSVEDVKEAGSDARRLGEPSRLARGIVSRDWAAHVAAVLAIAGLIGYSWWIPAAFDRRELTSVDLLFSELSADGQRHAALLQRLDIASGLLLLAAFLLRGAPSGSPAARRFHYCLLLFAAAAALGGLLPFACAPTLDHACHQAERHLQLPAHHYLHMISGVLEFAGATGAVLFGAALPGLIGRVARAGRIVLAISYPLLGAAYLTMHLGALAEPPFFITFTTIAAVALWAAQEPAS